MTTISASNDDSTIDRFKQAAAESAATQLKDGMVVGLGSGTTATLAVAAIGRRVKEGLRIIAIPTSEQTAHQARLLDIPLSTLEEHSAIDVTIDGADEVEAGTLNLIKGGGGNLLREKIVAIASSRMIIVADQRKMVHQLGSHAVIPVEIVSFGWKTTAKRLNQVGAHPTLRMGSDGQIFLTDGGHHIFDCAHGPIQFPTLLRGWPRGREDLPSGNAEAVSMRSLRASELQHGWLRCHFCCNVTRGLIRCLKKGS